MNTRFARLNHVLIPETWAARRRLQRSWLARPLAPLGWLYEAFSGEGQVLLLLALVAGLLGLDVGNTSVYLVWCVLAGLLVASLLLRPWFSLTGVEAELRVPRRVAIGQPQSFTLVVRNRSGRDHHALRIRGPFLPWDGKWAERPPQIETVAADGEVRRTTRAAFHQRGEHHLGPFALRPLVPLGLTLGRGVNSRDSRFLVLPAIAQLRSLALAETHRYQPGGVALASRTGESLELMGVRPYRPGDAVRDLHPRTWARAGQPMVREYQQEYFSRIGVILDTDQRAADEERLEAAISLAAGAVAHLARGEALIDLLVVGDRVHPLTMGRSLGYLEQALDLLAVVESGPRFETEGLVRRLRPHLGRLSHVVFVALAWDEPRQALVEEVARAGVGCRSVLVASDSGDPVADSGVAVVPAASVLGGEPLTL